MKKLTLLHFLFLLSFLFSFGCTAAKTNIKGSYSGLEIEVEIDKRVKTGHSCPDCAAPLLIKVREQ